MQSLSNGFIIMPNQIFYLKTCDTCKKIISQINDLKSFELIDIKEKPLTVHQLESLYQKTNSYEKLFSKRAKLYKERDLKNEDLSENDIKHLILEHYTFLSRPVIVYKDDVFIGNSPKTIAQMLEQVNAK